MPKATSSRQSDQPWDRRFVPYGRPQGSRSWDWESDSDDDPLACGSDSDVSSTHVFTTFTRKKRNAVSSRPHVPAHLRAGPRVRKFTAPVTTSGGVATTSSTVHVNWQPRVIDWNVHPEIMEAIMERSTVATLMAIRQTSHHFRAKVEAMLSHLRFSYSKDFWTGWNETKYTGVLKIHAGSGYLVALATDSKDLIQYQRLVHPRLPFYNYAETVKAVNVITRLAPDKSLTIDFIGSANKPLLKHVIKPICSAITPGKIKGFRYLPGQSGKLLSYFPRQATFCYLPHNHRTSPIEWRLGGSGSRCIPVYLIDGSDSGKPFPTRVVDRPVVLDFRPWRRENCHAQSYGYIGRLASLIFVLASALRCGRRGRRAIVIGIEIIDMAWLDARYDPRVHGDRRAYIRHLVIEHWKVPDEEAEDDIIFYTAGDPCVTLHNIHDFLVSTTRTHFIPRTTRGSGASRARAVHRASKGCVQASQVAKLGNRRSRQAAQVISIVVLRPWQTIGRTT